MTGKPSKIFHGVSIGPLSKILVVKLAQVQQNSTFLIISGDIVTGLVRQQIEKHVADTCNGSFTESKVNSLKVWLNSVVMGWIRNIYSGIQKIIY